MLNYQNKTHEYTVVYDTLTRIFAWFDDHRRVVNPAHVTYVLPPAEHPTLGLVHDGAYWLDGVQATDASKPATLDVASGGIPHPVPRPEKAQRTETDVDTHGPTGRSAGTLLRTVPAFDPAARRSNALTFTSRNARALSLDLRRARVRVTRRGLRITVDADSPIRLELRHVGARRARVAVDRKRRKRRLVRRKRTMTVSVPAGRHSVFLRAVRRRR